MTTTPKLDPVGLAVEACRRLWQARDHALLLGIPLLALGVGWDLVYGDDLRALLIAGTDVTTLTPSETIIRSGCSEASCSQNSGAPR